MDNKVNKDNANEPSALYNHNIKFFNSFEEMNDFDIQEMAKLNPIQRLRNISFLIQNIFAEELKKPDSDLILHFQ